MAISITSDYDDGTPGPTAQGAIGQSGEGPEAPILRRTRRQSAGSGPHTSPFGGGSKKSLWARFLRNHSAQPLSARVAQMTSLTI